MRGYLKALPDSEQPISLQGMHRAVRKWAEIQREGQGQGGGKRSRWEHVDDLHENRTKAQKNKDKKAKRKAEREKKEKEAEQKR